MTRMWIGVAPQDLCRQHLLGEHAECHQLAGTIDNHPHGDAIAAGHAAKGNIDTSKLQARHDALAAELGRRGHTHDSPLDYAGAHVGVGATDAAANRADLRERCANCAKRMAVEA